MLDEGNNAGIGIHGYEDAGEAVAAMLVHLRAIMRSSGKEMDLGFLGDDGITWAPWGRHG